MLHLLKTLFTGPNQFALGRLSADDHRRSGVYLRAVPETIWSWLVEQTTMMITVKDDDAAFVWVKEWFLEQRFLRIRRVDLDTTLRGEQIALIPAPGHHWFWYDGRPFQVWFSRSTETRERSTRRVESLTFRTLGRKQVFLQDLVADVVRCHTRRMGVQSYLYTYDEGWDYVEGYAPRLLDSVVLQSGEKEQLVEDVRAFRTSKQRYARLEIPTIVATCYMGLRGQVRLRWFRRWQLTLGCPSTWCVLQTSPIAA